MNGTATAETTGYSVADAAIEDIGHAAEYYARCTREEMELEEQRPALKRAAIARLMQTTNDLTGKPHSASSAEAIVETDTEYAAHRAKQIDAVCRKIEAKAIYESELIRAKLAAGREGACQ